MIAGLRACRFAALLVPAALAGACSQPANDARASTAVEIFRCQLLLMSRASAACREDVIGPGELKISFNPDPPRSSWEVAVRGLNPLAESCAFHGSFDQTRLAALQGRGAAELACPVAAGIDRAYHELAFENRLEAAGSSIAIAVTFSR